VFLVELALSAESLDRFMYLGGFVPALFSAPPEGGIGWIINRAIPIFTYMFLHGGWMHFLGNMWFLWLFGDNVEDRLGRPRFLLFYLACGVAAALAQFALAPGSGIPPVGASGAISGVMGAYFLLYPGARIVTLIPVIIFIQMVEIPAFVFLGIWFLMQFFSGTRDLAASAGNTGGIAFWAHIGGFIAGMLLLRAFTPRRLPWRTGS
jgi:membrane associated rhomboid family serine protease